MHQVAALGEEDLGEEALDAVGGGAEVGRSGGAASADKPITATATTGESRTMTKPMM